jgi:hypothetical protein
VQSNNHCRPITAFLTTPAVNASTQIQDVHPASDFALVSIDLPSTLSQTTVEQIAELNTGPPPDNLVVVLHHWVI